MMKNHVFLKLDFLIKNVGFFMDRTHSQAFCMVLKVLGRFWRSPGPTKIEKSEVQTPKKTRPRTKTRKLKNKMKNMKKRDPHQTLRIQAKNGVSGKK